MKHIQKLHLILVTLMAQGFPNRSLVDNKKLMTDLKEFQGIIFDRKQLYGDPNYEPVLLEKDLEQAENQLAQVIYEQLLSIDITKLGIDQLMKLHKDYEVYCHHRKVNDDGKAWRSQSAVRKEIVCQAKEMQKGETRDSYLMFVLMNSNSGHSENAEAYKLLHGSAVQIHSWQ